MPKSRPENHGPNQKRWRAPCLLSPDIKICAVVPASQNAGRGVSADTASSSSKSCDDPVENSIELIVRRSRLRQARLCRSSRRRSVASAFAGRSIKGAIREERHTLYRDIDTAKFHKGEDFDVSREIPRKTSIVEPRISFGVSAGERSGIWRWRVRTLSRIPAGPFWYGVGDFGQAGFKYRSYPKKYEYVFCCDPKEQTAVHQSDNCAPPFERECSFRSLLDHRMR